MNETAMTPLRESAFSILGQIPEEHLNMVIRFMQDMNVPPNRKNRKPGIAQGKFVCPDDIDADNEMIASWFEGTL